MRQDETGDSEDISPVSRLQDGFAFVAILGIGCLYFLAADREILGFDRDDGIYAITARALVEGKGFTLLNVVGEPAQVKFPILYPLFLILAWLLNPVFPGNLPIMHVLNTGVVTAGFLAVYFYFRVLKNWAAGWAFLPVLLTAASPGMMETGTRIFSESLYLLLSFLTLICAERYLRQASPMRLAALAIASSLMFHTRVIGVSLIAAVGIWLFLRNHGRHAWLYLMITVLATLVPWLLWTRANVPTELNDANFQLVHAYSDYGFEWLNNYGTGSLLMALTDNVVGIVKALAGSLFSLFPVLLEKSAHWLPVVLVESLFLMLGTVLFAYFAVLAGQMAARAIKRNSNHLISADGLYVALYIGVLTFWGYQDQMPRFLCVVLPLLWYFLLNAWRTFLDGQTSAFFIKAGNTALVLLILVALFPAPKIYWSSFVHIRANHLRWYSQGQYHPEVWSEYQAMFRHIHENLKDKAPLALNRDIVFYLYTGHPGYSLDTFHLKSPLNTDQFSDELGQILLSNLRHYGIAYLVVEPEMSRDGAPLKANRNLPALLAGHYPEHFKLSYTTPRNRLKLYRFVP